MKLTYFREQLRNLFRNDFKDYKGTRPSEYKLVFQQSPNWKNFRKKYGEWESQDAFLIRLKVFKNNRVAFNLNRKDFILDERLSFASKNAMHFKINSIN